MTVQDELRKFVAPEFIVGNNSRLLVARYVKNYGGRRVFLVTDRQVSENGWSEEIYNILIQKGYEVVKFDTISPNPRDYEIMEGVELYNITSCDVIVAVGGGSVLDCAKGIGVVATNGGHILDYEGVDKVIIPMPPLVCIPTTAGTSADVSQFAIVNNTTEKVKIAIISKSVVPDVALIDPIPLTSMSPYLTACTGLDAIVHAIEAYVSTASSPITNIHALEAIRLISNNLIDSVNNPDDLSLRNLIMQASLQAGLAFSNASLGCVHSMAHSLGGALDLTHGECNAVLLPHVVDYNFSASPEKFLNIGEIMGCNTRGLSEKESHRKILDAMIALRKKCKIDEGLEARGVKQTDIRELASKAINDPCIATNPRIPNQRDIEVMYEEAL